MHGTDVVERIAFDGDYVGDFLLLERAQAILKRLQTNNQYVSPAKLAVLYAALGERELAFAALERAYAARDLQLQFLGVDPDYDSLRSDPRFPDLLRRVGLPQ